MNIEIRHCFNPAAGFRVITVGRYLSGLYDVFF